MATAKPAKKPGALKNWWKIQGGSQLLKSGYLWLSVVLLLPTAHLWLVGDWWLEPLAVLPNVLGFSLGGYAILLAFGDNGFQKILVLETSSAPADDEKKTIYIRVSATFLHFILVQVLALMVALVAKSLNFPPEEIPLIILPSAASAGGRYVLGALGFFLFLYAMNLAIAAALSVFKLSEWFESYLKSQVKREAIERANKEPGTDGN